MKKNNQIRNERVNNVGGKDKRVVATRIHGQVWIVQQVY